MAKRTVGTKTEKAPKKSLADRNAGRDSVRKGPSESRPLKGGAETGPAAGPEASFPVVGVGASAGGLEAFTALLKALSADTGMAFVLIQHMDPSHQSVLTSLLQKATAMPVQQVTNSMAVEPNHVYVIPPNALMTISKRVLTLTPRHERSFKNLPIDHFFNALAEDLQGQAIGVILSGTASDGTQGLRAIKAQGGITFAQDEESAQHPGMPMSAVASGCVDFTMPPAKIALELAQINGHPYFGSIQSPELSPAGAGDVGLALICSLLRTATGVDFHLYKPATISRRVARRMALHKLRTVKEYVDLLAKDRVELNALYEDIFIHVTSFFRDPESLQALQQLVFSKIPPQERSARTIRVWVPGCSSGEEVYSVAMLLMEHLGDRRNQLTIQFFGTDISEHAIALARVGIYSESSLAQVSKERRRRFFNKVEGGYQIAKSLRDLCVFARHDLARDPPFSKLDLVTCRNVLIYLGPVLQKRVVEVFHYSLKPDGYLLLGKSESLSAYTNLFSLEDSKHKIFSRRPFITPLHLAESRAKRAGVEPAPPIGGPGTAAFDLRREAERLLLDQYAPAALVVDPMLQIIQFQGNVGPFLAPAAGEPSFHLLKMVRPELVPDLRSAIHQVKKEGAAVRKDGVRLKRNGTFVSADIQVSPLKGRHAREFDFLVVLQETAKPEPADAGKPPSTRRATKDRPAAELAHRDRELASLHEQLRTLVQEHAAASEEMQAMNEELLSANEELQSSNEELETAKEELESSNEELTTLNDESQKRNAEQVQLTDDLSNLLSGVNIPIVILDLDLRIRRFTPLAERVLNLIPTDLGRPLTDIATTVDVVDWGALTAQVIKRSQVVEREVRARDGRWYNLQMRPYWTEERKISGVLMALLDIDVVKRSLNEAQEARDFAEAIVETVREPLLVLDAEFTVVKATRSFYRTFQVSSQVTDGQSLFDLGNGQWAVPGLRELLTHLLQGEGAFENFRVDHDFPLIGHRSMLLNGRQISPRSGGTPLILLSIVDVTLREHADRAKLAGAREEERRMIAAELHDDLVQQLAGLAIDVGRRATLLPGPSSQLKQELQSFQSRAVRAAEAARNVAYKLHPTELDYLGLEVALRSYCKEFGPRQGIAIEFKSQNLPAAFTKEIAYCLYKVALECLRNIAKHAQAKRATVLIAGTSDEVRLRVEDFGVGFLVSSLSGTAGLGILSMKERVELAKGKFSIASEPGKGTRISVELPFQETLS